LAEGKQGVQRGRRESKPIKRGKKIWGSNRVARNEQPGKQGRNRVGAWDPGEQQKGTKKRKRFPRGEKTPVGAKKTAKKKKGGFVKEKGSRCREKTRRKKIGGVYPSLGGGVENGTPVEKRELRTKKTTENISFGGKSSLMGREKKENYPR